jgi:hypothetical protein
MVRHEIIALHLAVTFREAEFYPSCSQIKVGGNETGAPNPNECVTFPGGYSDNDPGIFDRQVYDPSAPYIFPGPPIASFVNGTTSDGGNSGSTVSATTSTGTTTSTTTSTAGSAPPAQSSQASGESCRVTKFSNTHSADASQPRHLSRIMRLFAFGEGRH